MQEGFQAEDTEKSCRYISTQGIQLSCDLYNTSPTSDAMSIYVHCDMLQEFAESMKTNPYTYILVCGGGDLTFPQNLGMDYRVFLEDEKLLHMFVNNSSVSHEKLTLLPLGINYHSLNEGKMNIWGQKQGPAAQDSELAEVQNILKPFKHRVQKCYGNFHFNKQDDRTYTYDRKDAIEKVPKDLIDYEATFIPRLDTWKKQGEYAFVVAPHGNGLDCHRQWEALCLGCIPIVKTSSIDSEYDELPVLIVNDWSDVTRELLDSTVQEFSTKKFDMDRLLLSYWVNRINTYKEDS